jgi:tetratricopeptide (TPR) repeat protein
MDDLRAELERLYELDELAELSRDLLGLDPEAIGGTAAKASFAKALIEFCRNEEAMDALADAVVAQRGDEARLFSALRAQGFAIPEQLESGSSLGPYVVVERIGEGHAGISYLAQLEGRDVRLKVLRRRATLDKRALQRFSTATRLAGALTHPGIPRRIWAGRVDDRWAVRHDFVVGESLAAQVALTGALPFLEIRDLVRAILEPLAELHARRLVHGDLSLENVLVVTPTAENRAGDAVEVVLLDAATFHLQTSFGSNGLPLGSCSTISPERIAGRAVDARSDVYSFAALLFELLTGKPPFVGDTDVDVLVGHLSLRPEPPSASAPPGYVSAELDELVLRMLDKSPARRPRNASVVLDALQALDLGAFAELAAMPDDELDQLVEPLISAPDDEQAAAELEAAIAQGADPRRVAEAFRLAAKLSKASPEARRGLLLRAAKIYGSAAPDRIAAEQVLGELWRLDPSDETSGQALLRLRRQLGKWTEVVEMLLDRSERAPSGHERGRILAEIGKLYATELDDRTQAVVAYAEAFCQDPEEASYAAEVERLASSSHAAWTEALGLCVEAAAGEMPTGSKNLLWVRMARWYSEKVNRPDLALPCYVAVLSSEPANDAALEGMSAIYRSAKSWTELGMVLIRRADLTESPGLARDLRTEAAGILERELGQEASARELYERIVAEDPSHDAAGNALTKIYQSAGEHERALQLLERRADALRGEPRHALMCRAAELFEGPLGDFAEAIRRYEAVLAEDPAEPTALRGLDRAHAQTGAWDELLRVLRRQLGLSLTPRQKSMLWERIARVYAEELIDHDLAAEAWEQVLELDPQNQDGFAALPKHYRALERYSDLAELFQHQLRVVTDPKRRVEIGLQLGAVLARPLESTEAAISAYEAVLEIEPEHPAALQALGSLRASRGDISHALDALDALAANAATPAARAEQYRRAARLLEENGELDLAIERYQLALDSVPHDPATSAALRAAYVARGDAKAAVELIDQELTATESAHARSKLHGEKARLCFELLGDESRAEQAARLTISEDPTNLDALTVLGDVAFSASHFLEAAKQYEQVTNRLDALDNAEAARVIARHAEALARSGAREKALEKAEWLLRVQPGNPTSMRVAADIVFAHGEPRRALELYTELALQRDALPERHQAKVLYGLGESARRLGELDVARGALEEALALDPSSPLPHRALAKAFEADERWSDMARVLYGLLDVVAGEGRVTLLIEIGDLAGSKLRDVEYAAKMYLAALYESPDDRKVLMKLMQLYGEAEDWDQLVIVIERLAELVDDDVQRAKYLKTAGEIAAKQLGDFERAVRLLDQAVSLDPSSEAAVDEALRQHRSLGDAQQVKQLLKQRIKLALEKDERETMLARMAELADLYLRHFSDVRQAVAVYESMQDVDPGNAERTGVLAGLYASRPSEYFAKAVAAYQLLLAQNPQHVDAYRALRRLHTEARFVDGAWCLCQALTLLGLAEDDEREFFERLRSEGAAPARQSLSDADWSNLVMHQDADPLVSSILALIEPAVIAARSKTLKELGYRKEHALDPARDPYSLVQSLAWGAEVLGMPLPPLFHNANDAGGLSFLHAKTPSIVLGRAALGTEVAPQAAAFIAGQQLASFRAGHYVRHLLPSGTALKSWLTAAIKLIAPGFPVAAELARPIQEALAALETALTSALRDHLASIVSRLLQQGAPLDLKKWIAGADLTADRAGLILCHDLETAVEMVRASRQDASAVPPADRIRALVLYSVSPEYFRVREQLGVEVRT